MRRNILLLSLLSTLLFFSACQKEYSLELSGTISSGSLQSDVAGECLPKTVEGIYEAGTVLNATANYIDVQVNVATVGTYRVYSDTVNGIFFQATGTFATTGINNVRLTGNGTPLNAGIQNFVITYDTTECSVAVTTLPQGGAAPAEFTLVGAPNTCLDFSLSGTYIKGAALTAANTVAIKVNVTKIGTYNINTGAPSNGITFSGTGALTTLGEQTITLTGSGTPAVAMSTNMVVEKITANCGFTVNVTEGAAFTIDCTSVVAAGTYEKGVALGASNTIDLTVNVTTAGPYAITTTAINGMTFSGSGSFTTAGPGQIIRLTGSGTPTVDGTFNISIPGACAFEVVVVPGAATIDWKFTEAATTFQGPVTDATLEVVPIPAPGSGSFTLFSFSGETVSGDILEFELFDLAGGIQNNETYSSSSAGTTNATAFLYIGATQSYSADPSLTGVTLTFKVTSHVTGTKTIEGTFSGTVKDDANATKTITNGTFKGTYP